jgi:hypothetical protein
MSSTEDGTAQKAKSYEAEEAKACNFCFQE